MTSVWNPDNIRDVAESVGIANLNKDVVESLARDVDYRIAQVLEEALKFMRHGKRTTLSTQDVSLALRALEVEPLYGYESRRPLRFGEASLGPGQPLYYVEDEEVDLEKLINAPLPKVPHETTFTAHWLAIEGVQPSIPQNPSSLDNRTQDLLPRGPGANQHLAAAGGSENIAVRPLVKHVISKELQLYFERVCSAVLDRNNEEYRNAALNSVKEDTGLHQLVPYFVNYIAEKVTQNLRDLFILTQMMHLSTSLLLNSNLYIDPYVSLLIPSALTCLIGKKIGQVSDSVADQLALRNLAASILFDITRKYGSVARTLKARIAYSCLDELLREGNPLGTLYGALLGLSRLTGAEGVRQLVLPNVKLFDETLRDALADDSKRELAEAVRDVMITSLNKLARENKGLTNGHLDGDGLKSQLVERLGDIIGSAVYEQGNSRLATALLEGDLANLD